MNSDKINGEWIEARDEYGRIYFANPTTRETSWTIPSNNNNNTNEHANTDDVESLPDNWERLYDERSQRYFYVNHEAQITTWEHPSQHLGIASGSEQPITSTNQFSENNSNNKNANETNNTACQNFVPPIVGDTLRSQCSICDKTFLFRRHHCRICQDVVCATCSNHRVLLPYENVKFSNDNKRVQQSILNVRASYEDKLLSDVNKSYEKEVRVCTSCYDEVVQLQEFDCLRRYLPTLQLFSENTSLLEDALESMNEFLQSKLLSQKHFEYYSEPLARVYGPLLLDFLTDFGISRSIRVKVCSVLDTILSMSLVYLSDTCSDDENSFVNMLAPSPSSSENSLIDNMDSDQPERNPSMSHGIGSKYQEEHKNSTSIEKIKNVVLMLQKPDPMPIEYLKYLYRMGKYVDATQIVIEGWSDIVETNMVLALDLCCSSNGDDELQEWSLSLLEHCLISLLCEEGEFADQSSRSKGGGKCEEIVAKFINSGGIVIVNSLLASSKERTRNSVLQILYRLSIFLDSVPSLAQAIYQGIDQLGILVLQDLSAPLLSLIHKLVRPLIRWSIIDYCLNKKTNRNELFKGVKNGEACLSFTSRLLGSSIERYEALLQTLIDPSDNRKGISIVSVWTILTALHVAQSLSKQSIYDNEVAVWQAILYPVALTVLSKSYGSQDTEGLLLRECVSVNISLTLSLIADVTEYSSLLEDDNWIPVIIKNMSDPLLVASPSQLFTRVSNSKNLLNGSQSSVSSVTAFISALCLIVKGERSQHFVSWLHSRGLEQLAQIIMSQAIYSSQSIICFLDIIEAVVNNILSAQQQSKLYLKSSHTKAVASEQLDFCVPLLFEWFVASSRKLFYLDQSGPPPYPGKGASSFSVNFHEWNMDEVLSVQECILSVFIIVVENSGSSITPEFLSRGLLLDDGKYFEGAGETLLAISLQGMYPSLVNPSIRLLHGLSKAKSIPSKELGQILANSGVTESLIEKFAFSNGYEHDKQTKMILSILSTSAPYISDSSHLLQLLRRSSIYLQSSEYDVEDILTTMNCLSSNPLSWSYLTTEIFPYLRSMLLEYCERIKDLSKEDEHSLGLILEIFWNIRSVLPLKEILQPVTDIFSTNINFLGNEHQLNCLHELVLDSILQIGDIKDIDLVANIYLGCFLCVIEKALLSDVTKKILNLLTQNKDRYISSAFHKLKEDQLPILVSTLVTYSDDPIIKDILLFLLNSDHLSMVWDRLVSSFSTGDERVLWIVSLLSSKCVKDELFLQNIVHQLSTDLDKETRQIILSQSNLVETCIQMLSSGSRGFTCTVLELLEVIYIPSLINLNTDIDIILGIILREENVDDILGQKIVSLCLKLLSHLVSDNKRAVSDNMELNRKIIMACSRGLSNITSEKLSSTEGEGYIFIMTELINSSSLSQEEAETLSECHTILFKFAINGMNQHATSLWLALFGFEKTLDLILQNQSFISGLRMAIRKCSRGDEKYEKFLFKVYHSHLLRSASQFPKILISASIPKLIFGYTIQQFNDISDSNDSVPNELFRLALGALSGMKVLFEKQPDYADQVFVTNEFQVLTQATNNIVSTCFNDTNQCTNFDALDIVLLLLQFCVRRKRSLSVLDAADTGSSALASSLTNVVKIIQRNLSNSLCAMFSTEYSMDDSLLEEFLRTQIRILDFLCFALPFVSQSDEIIDFYDIFISVVEYILLSENKELLQRNVTAANKMLVLSAKAIYYRWGCGTPKNSNDDKNLSKEIIHALCKHCLEEYFPSNVDHSSSKKNRSNGNTEQVEGELFFATTQLLHLLSFSVDNWQIIIKEEHSPLTLLFIMVSLNTASSSTPIRGIQRDYYLSAFMNSLYCLSSLARHLCGFTEDKSYMEIMSKSFDDFSQRYSCHDYMFVCNSSHGQSCGGQEILLQILNHKVEAESSPDAGYSRVLLSTVLLWLENS